jgi:hypothetical protein
MCNIFQILALQENMKALKKMQYLCLTMLLFGFSTTPTLGEIAPLELLIPEDVLADYKLFINKRSPLDITNFSGQSSRRDVVEVVLLQQALHKGRITRPLKFISVNSYQRILREIQSGNALMAGNSSWKTDLDEIKEDVLISVPLIRDGEFEAGLYTTPTNKLALSASSLSDIKSLSAVSSRGWKVDWATLETLNLSRLDNTVTWISMVKMVSIKRADFLLAPFQPTDDLSMEVENLQIIPIPNIKIGLKGSRHFAISKFYPNASKIHEGLNKGLIILREDGTIKKAYQQSGFFNSKVKDWKKLTP